MPLSHSALFRDPTEPAGFDAKPQYPLRGPFGYWDTRDHNHGGTGYVVRDAGNTATIVSTGTLPNSGSAGSTFDFPITQTSQWQGGTVPPYAVYLTEGTISDLTPSASDVTAYMGGLPSAGPYTFIYATGNATDTRLIDPSTGNYSAFLRNQYQVNPTTVSGPVIWRWSDELGYGFTNYSIEHDNAVYPAISANGSNDWSVQDRSNFNMTLASGFLDNKLMVDMIDIVSGLFDFQLNGVWQTDDDNHGITPFNRFNSWWPLPGNSSGFANPANADRNVARRNNSNGWATAAVVDQWYNPGTAQRWDGFAATWNFFNSRPVQGQPWPLMRAWGLWRGTPTAADLAAIATDMGL
jgi:hypothetical protein